MSNDDDLDMTAAVTTPVFNERTAGPTRNPLAAREESEPATKPAGPPRRRKASAASTVEPATSPSKVIQVHLDPELLAKLDETGLPRGAAAMRAMADSYAQVKEALRPQSERSDDNPFAMADARRNHKLRPLGSGKVRVSVALTVPRELFDAFEEMRRELGASRGVLLEEAISLWDASLRPKAEHG